MKQQLISFFKKNPGRSLKSKALAKLLEYREEHEYHAMKAMLHQLVEEGFLQREGKRYKLFTAGEGTELIGVLQLSNTGYGFVIPSTEGIKDIYIPEKYIGTAVNGDVVNVILLGNRNKGKSLEGKIISIVKRRYKEVIGRYKKINGIGFVVPDSKEISFDILISPETFDKAKNGEKVVVGNIKWDKPDVEPIGDIIEVLSNGKYFANDLLSIVSEFELPYIFPTSVLEEAESIENKIPEEEYKNRIDYRDKVVITIDPEDAKDFDDALSIEELENGNYSIGIHIADVSYYVKDNSSLDREAQKRGNSVYLVGTVVPMLPEKLSNNICSLRPNEDRLTYSVIVEMTPRGTVVSSKINQTIINSKRRFTYEEVQKIIESEEGDCNQEVLNLYRISRILRNKRMKKGSINFATPEVRFILDENGIPIDAVKKEMKESNQLVEEFMLLANQIVSEKIGKPKKDKKKLPFVYRVHDKPNEEKITEFSRFLKSLGYNFSPEMLMKPKSFNELMEKVNDKPEKDVVNELAIRSMAKAVYSNENIKHFGLGFSYYSHFTSPIRRYADLLVHRLLKNYLEHNRKISYSENKLEVICEHISFTERNAIEAERLSVKLKHIEFLENKVGEEFDAIISGVTHFGIFVKLQETLAEGLIHVRDLEGDYFTFDEKSYSLKGKISKKTFRLGDKVNVKLIRVDRQKKELDFIINNNFN